MANAEKEVKTSQNSKQNKRQKKQSGVSVVKATTSELKKVSWPSFPKVVKQTGVVITVVLAFTLVLFGFDRLFSFLYTLLPF